MKRSLLTFWGPDVEIRRKVAATKGNPFKTFDWDKAALIIKECYSIDSRFNSGSKWDDESLALLKD